MDKVRAFLYDEGRKGGMPMEIGAKLRWVSGSEL